MFISIMNSGNQSPLICRPTVASGTSKSIKVWGLSNSASFNMGFVIINKDPDDTITGNVIIKAESVDQLECIYLSSPSLTATSGFKLGGYSYVPSDAAPQGTYASKLYDNINKTYTVDMSFGRVAYCITTLSITKFSNIVTTS